jgi:hypothetical protein
MIEAAVKKIFFRSSGKPKRIVRKVLFRKSLKPHGIFRPLVLTKNGNPNSYFKRWMDSDEYINSSEAYKTKKSDQSHNKVSSLKISKRSIFTIRSQNKKKIEALSLKLDNLSSRFEMLATGFSASIEGLEKCSNRQEMTLNQICALPGLRELELILEDENVIERILKRIEWIEVDNDNIRGRIEFIRKEVMFELRKSLGIVGPFDNTPNQKESKIINAKALSEEIKRVNLGCGHVPKVGYINVDARELPGVDLVANVTSLPFEPGSVSEIYASHLIEHFSDRALIDTILPHWKEILKPKGRLILITPNADAMMNQYQEGTISFDKLREIIFGGQEYDGDFHFTMISPDLPPGRPSFITRVLGVDSCRFRVGQARRARSPQIAQALGALLPGFCFPARNAA